VPKHQHTAVDRNRLKRRVRELVRVELLPALRERATADLAIRAQSEAYSASFEQLRANMLVLIDRVRRADPGPV
jgi:ribonuclease P protein component